jgi:hypothetical protein
LLRALGAGGGVTLTGMPEYVEAGVAIGIGERGGRPLIRVNLDASRAQGASLAAELLAISDVVRAR